MSIGLYGTAGRERNGNEAGEASGLVAAASGLRGARVQRRARAAMNRAALARRRNGGNRRCALALRLYGLVPARPCPAL